MVWRRSKRRQASGSPPSVDSSRHAAYLPPDDPPLAELRPRLDIWDGKEQAIQDILYLYWDLATSWCGINGQAELGSFDRWRWLQCEAYYEAGEHAISVWCTYDDALLLRQGSAVALLCELDYEWDREDEVNEHVWKVALEAGRFDHLPEARRAVVAGLHSLKEMHKELPVVYDEYVVAFFEMLAREGRPPTRTAFAYAALSEDRPRSSFRDPR